MKTTPTTFPVIIKKGSSTVKVYDAKPGFPYFRLMYHLGGRRIMRTFPTLEAAKAEADVVLQNLSKGDLDALQLTGKDRLIYGRALAAVKPFDVALDDAAREYATARKILGTHSLVEAAKHFIRHNSATIIPATVADVVVRLVESKRRDGMSVVYLDDLRQRCGRFAAAFRCNINDVSADAVKAWMDALPLSRRTFNNFHGCLRALFEFAKENKHLSKATDLLEGVKRKKNVGSAGANPFSRAEMVALLQHSTPEILPLIALAGFAGVRKSELLRLEWKHVKMAERHVEVPAGKAKTGRRRIVPIQPNLAQWLAPFAKQAGPIWPHSKSYFSEVQAEVAAAAGVEWKDNGLRDAFISCRVAVTKNMEQVALEAGNSPRMILTKYLKAVTEEEGKAWFAITPAPAANVVPMAAVA